MSPEDAGATESEKRRTASAGVCGRRVVPVSFRPPPATHSATWSSTIIHGGLNVALDALGSLLPAAMDQIGFRQSGDGDDPLGGPAPQRDAGCTGQDRTLSVGPPAQPGRRHAQAGWTVPGSRARGHDEQKCNAGPTTVERGQ